MDLFKRTLGPVERVMKDGHLGVSEVDEVVLVGGSTRIPKVMMFSKGVEYHICSRECACEARCGKSMYQRTAHGTHGCPISRYMGSDSFQQGAYFNYTLCTYCVCAIVYVSFYTTPKGRGPVRAEPSNGDAQHSWFRAYITYVCFWFVRDYTPYNDIMGVSSLKLST